MSHLTKREPPDRSKINIASAAQLKCWARHLEVSTAQLREVVEKVGDSAVTVRKELEALRKDSGAATAE